MLLCSAESSSCCWTEAFKSEKYLAFDKTFILNDAFPFYSCILGKPSENWGRKAKCLNGFSA